MTTFCFDGASPQSQPARILQHMPLYKIGQIEADKSAWTMIVRVVSDQLVLRICADISNSRGVYSLCVAHFFQVVF